MNKFICFDCEEIFDEPSQWEEHHNLDHGPFEQMSGGPYWGGGYAKAYGCDMCGHYINGTYVKLTSGERICENCYNTYEIGEED